ncbi:MAG: GNAT family N-acetyltransferase [Pyrinomonadaceae bacterium]
MNLQIRKAAQTDVPSVLVLIREFAEFEKLINRCEVSENDLRAAIFGANNFVHCLVAENEKSLVGYALFFPVFKSFRGERSMFLEDLYVSPKARGQGLGLKMLREVARIAKRQNCVRMDWQALRWNAPAIEFYKNLGAETDDENLDFRLRGAAFEKLIA